MTKMFSRGHKGFTLVEVLVVVSILGTLTAVVTPNVIGFVTKGGTEAYQADKQVIQLATASFFTDIHAGANDTDEDDPAYAGNYTADLYDDNSWANETVMAGHRLPTAIARASGHVLKANTGRLDGHTTNPRIDLGNGSAATDDDISAHAIWMGLLARGPGDHKGDSSDRGRVAPIAGENGPYIMEIPESALAGDQWNGGPGPSGAYCWVVARGGTVYGCYRAGDGHWYTGYNGLYP